MKVELLAITPKPEEVIEFAARVCYRSMGKKGPGTAAKLIPKLIAMRHESPLEHASATFYINGCSRAMTHQLVRHRLISVSQESQRYVDKKSFAYVIPPSVAGKQKKEFKKDMENIRAMYAGWQNRGLKKEDARFVLPNACASDIVISANFREFRHIFAVRCSPHAQWEIRETCSIMLRELYARAPSVFQDQISFLEKKFR
ncbi:MAG: FAD-dependent thymidylate synthase [Kiritimatiellia bacterium]|nr:FAD-dependent thymidylate synthase [Kiritimatiellia bacterium]